MGGAPCVDSECRAANLELLRQVTTLFKQYGIKYWLDFGALLGVVREGDMIVGDDDTDLGASMDDLEAVQEALAILESTTTYTVRKSTAHKRCGDFSGEALVLYQVRGETELLDVFFFKLDSDGETLRSMWTSDDDTKMSTIFPVRDKYVDAWGFDVQVPFDPVARLVEKYGEDYMTPKDTKNHLRSKVRRSVKVWARCARNKSKVVIFLTILLLYFTHKRVKT